VEPLIAGSERYFLLEIGCEEIPDGMIAPALEHLEGELAALARRERLGDLVLEPESLGTPRRLAVRGRGLLDRQADREVEVTGPRVEAAYDQAGRPTRALEGFARSQGVAVESLSRIASAKGECVVARRTEQGRSAFQVLSAGIPEIVTRIPFGKTMRWGEGSFRFARPLQWLVCLLGSEVVPFELAGISSGRRTRGPRFDRSPMLEIADARDYMKMLESHGVVAEFPRRRRRIQEGIARECARLGVGCSTEDHPELLDSLTGMVEHPVAVAGGFDAAFLNLPAPVLSTAMIHHQRFIPVRNAQGASAPHYIAILNCREDPSTIATIRRGNEWVLRARLRDADFFWTEDRKRTLQERIPDLERVLFEATLGSYRLKVERVAKLAKALCEAIAGRGQTVESGPVMRAAQIAKSDLTTLMVKEFPELQGVMGGLYARQEGEPDAVSQAISQQYWGTGDTEGRKRFLTSEGAVLAMADRMDTLAGFFLLDRIPTGSRDPYGLRRSALALIQAALDRSLHFSLQDLKQTAVSLYAEQGVQPRGAGVDRLTSFIEERIRHLCQEALGLPYDAVNAALAVGADDPLDAVRRAEALQGIRGHADFEALSLSFRRIRNILAAQEVAPFTSGRLQLSEERLLLESLERAERESGPLLDAREYPGALRVLAGVRPSLDRFFEKVLVMDPDAEARRNRLGLLKRISLLLLRVGDFAEMVLEGEPAPSGAGGANRG
jgi:glycyl-tRNA synthetase beta chain